MKSYLQFSQVIPKLTEEEAAWFPKYMESRHKGLTLEGEPIDYDENSFFPDFRFEIRTGEGPWETYAWFYSTANGSVIQVAEVVQEFLKRFRRNAFFVLTWAEWTDIPRVGQFDGGGLFVTAEDIETFHAGGWVYDREKQFRATQEVSRVNP